MNNKLETIDIPVYVKNGGMIYRRDCLSWDDPNHTYNWIKSNYNVDPEEYGIEHPLIKWFENKSRSELIDMIVNMEQEIIGYQFYGV